jgi:hypothetical protein
LELRRSFIVPQLRVNVTLRLVDRSGRPDRYFGGNASATVHRRPKLLHLFRQQVAMFPGMHVQRKRAVAHPLELLYVVTCLLKHRANLAITPFNQRDLVPRIFRFMDKLDACRRSTRVDAFAVRQLNASAKPLDRRIAGLSAHLDEIRFRNMRRRFGQGVGQLAVVGQQQKTFACIVEPPHRVHPLFHTLQ